MEKTFEPPIKNACLEDSGFYYTMSLINGKYKLSILYTLASYKAVRFNELQRYIGSISYKTLSSTLKELEADRLILRKEYSQVPPRVEYSLSGLGMSLIPALHQLSVWGEKNCPDLGLRAPE